MICAMFVVNVIALFVVLSYDSSFVIHNLRHEVIYLRHFVLIADLFVAL